MSQNILTTCQIYCYAVSSRRDMDSTRPMKVSCGICIWHQDISSICRLRDEAGVDWTCWSSTSHRLDWDLGDLEVRATP